MEGGNEEKVLTPSRRRRRKERKRKRKESTREEGALIKSHPGPQYLDDVGSKKRTARRPTDSRKAVTQQACIFHACLMNRPSPIREVNREKLLLGFAGTSIP